MAKNPTVLASYPAATPLSIMIQRKGNNFSAGISPDGTNYTAIPGSTADLDLPTTTLQGLAVASGSSSLSGTASFSGLSAGPGIVTTMAPPSPADPCPSSWTCADLGNPSPSGHHRFGELAHARRFGHRLRGQHRFDALRVPDGYRQRSRSRPGNDAVRGAGKTQDGLMMRANASPTSPMYSVYLNPGGSAIVQWRVSDGVTYDHNIPLTTVTSPAYLELVRWQYTNSSPARTYFSTLTSTDGVTWTPVLGSSVAVTWGPAVYLAGLAATSGITGATTPATFNRVSLAA